MSTYTVVIGLYLSLQLAHNISGNLAFIRAQPTHICVAIVLIHTVVIDLDLWLQLGHCISGNSFYFFI
jgi:hypothetical protein